MVLLHSCRFMAVYLEICYLGFLECRYEEDLGLLLGFGVLLEIKAVEVLAPDETKMQWGLGGRTILFERSCAVVGLVLGLLLSLRVCSVVWIEIVCLREGSARSYFVVQDFSEFVVLGLLGFNFVISLSDFMRSFLVLIFSTQAF